MKCPRYICERHALSCPLSVGQPLSKRLHKLVPWTSHLDISALIRALNSDSAYTWVSLGVLMWCWAYLDSLALEVRGGTSTEPERWNWGRWEPTPYPSLPQLRSHSLKKPSSKCRNVFIGMDFHNCILRLAKFEYLPCLQAETWNSTY